MTRTTALPYATNRSTATASIPGPRDTSDVVWRVALYLRLSVADLDSDVEDAVSAGIDRQRSDTLALAHRLGVPGDAVVRLHTDPDAATADVVVYIEDGESAWRRRRVSIRDQYGETRDAWRVVRPVWGQMARDLRAGMFGQAIVYNSDRLARDPFDVEDIIETAEHYRVRWDAATGSLDLSTDDGRAMLRIMTAVANKSSADTSRRVARAHRQRIESGLPNWNVRPFGHDVKRDDKGKVVEIVLNPAEAEAIQVAARRLLAGTTTLGEIARAWNEAGLRTTGKARKDTSTGEWRSVKVGQLLRQARIAGLIEHNGQVAGTGNWPAIIEPDVWRGLVAKLNTNNGKNLPRGEAGHGVRVVSLLSGEDSPARCGECGEKLTVANIRLSRGSTDKTRVYKCVKGCVVMGVDEVDREVMARVAVAAAEHGVTVLRGDAAPDTTAQRAEESRLIAKLATIQAQIDADALALEDGLPLLTSTRRKLDAVRKEFAAIESTAVYGPEHVRKALDKLRSADLGEARSEIKRFYASIRIVRRYADQTFDTQRVVTRFTDWLPADSPAAGRDITDVNMFVDLKSDALVFATWNLDNVQSMTE